MASELPARPFRGHDYELGHDRAGCRVTLTPFAGGEADELGRQLAAIEPWVGYGVTAERMAAFLAAGEADAPRRAIRRDERLAGVAVVRYPWLHGPYLQLLGFMPGDEGHGAGSLVLDWIEAEGRRAGCRNLWLCVTASNARARSFYERHGYGLAGTLDGLVADGMTELLMRKMPSAGP